MRLFILVLAATTACVVAQPHRHSHRHFPRVVSKRDPAPAAVYEPGPVATVIVYVLNGQPISEEEVRMGVANGTLVWGDDGNLSTSIAASATPVALPTETAPFESAVSPQSTESSIVHQEGTASSTVQPEQQPSPTPESSQPASVPSQAPEQPSYDGGANDNINKEFPNGEFSCESFPLGYGATPIDHAGLGGWIGIQDPGFAGAAGFDDIMTVPHGTCSDGTCCHPGAFCSYSCPPGYLKSSWPEKQGIKKQSVGGLYCNMDNKLELASGAIAKTLCIKGTDKVTIQVQNKLSVSESICRTDYPGM